MRQVPEAFRKLFHREAWVLSVRPSGCGWCPERLAGCPRVELQGAGSAAGQRRLPWLPVAGASAHPVLGEGGFEQDSAICVCMCVCICVWVHMCLPVRLCVCGCMCVNLYARMCVCVWVWPVALGAQRRPLVLRGRASADP